MTNKKGGGYGDVTGDVSTGRDFKSHPGHHNLIWWMRCFSTSR
jgi:hypothetical protein